MERLENQIFGAESSRKGVVSKFPKNERLQPFYIGDIGKSHILTILSHFDPFNYFLGKIVGGELISLKSGTF